MSQSMVVFFTFMLFVFALYGLISFMADINRLMKRKAKQPKKKKGGNHNEKEDIKLP